jgi:carbon-monoxide dehydrogenase medium subunit
MDMPEYLAPVKLDDALKIKGQRGAQARVIAGGTDLILRMRDGVHSPQLLLDLRKASLNNISSHTGHMHLGAYLTLAQILENSELQNSFPSLLDACREFAGPPIRNRATLGGNIVNASPAADLTPPLIAYDADIVLVSSTGERVISLADFFTGPGQSVIQPEEILTEVCLPITPENTAASFIKLGQRRSMAISIVNLCTRITLDAGGIVNTARIVLGSVAATPVRAIEAESLLTGRELTDDLIDQAARKAREETSPITDVRASEDYRSQMVVVLVRRALCANRDMLLSDDSND